MIDEVNKIDSQPIIIAISITYQFATSIINRRIILKQTPEGSECFPLFKTPVPETQGVEQNQS